MCAALATAGWLAILAMTASPVTAVRSNATDLSKEPKHPVSDPMWERSKALGGRPAPAFALGDTRGGTQTLATLAKNGPVAIVFTKDGCPCSMESQPFFNGLAQAFTGRATFLGVIDSDLRVATLYQENFKVPYAMALAGDQRVFADYDAKRSVYVTLVAKGGQIVRQWPGYSKTMLKELNQALADETGQPPAKLDVAMAPDAMTSGCAFEKSTPNGV